MPQSYVYVLSNISMPGLLKIGRTDRSPIDRAKKLGTTGVPTPFTLEYFVPVENAVEAEATIHKVLEEKGYRTSKVREFFELSVSEAKVVIELALNMTATGSPDFSLKQLLSDELSKIVFPWNRQTSKEEAWQLGERLAEIARRGLPEAMKRGAQLYDMSCKWESQFRKYFRDYLELGRADALNTSIFGTGKSARYGLGKDVAAYLDTLCRNEWLTDDDLDYVSNFLVAGDQHIYDGYIDEVRRPEFSAAIRDRALNV